MNELIAVLSLDGNASKSRIIERAPLKHIFSLNYSTDSLFRTSCLLKAILLKANGETNTWDGTKSTNVTVGKKSAAIADIYCLTCPII